MSNPTKQVNHPVFARVFERFSRAIEGREQIEHRREALAGLSGSVIEVGAGNGLNFAHYPQSVTRVLAVEPEGYLRERAVEAARKAPVDVQVVAGTAEQLPAGDGEFDAGVFCHVLCSVRSPEQALAEMFRVIKPGGELRFYEHVASDERSVLRLQKVIEPGWKRISGNCHLTRDTASAIERSGFVMEQWRSFDFKPNALSTHVAPHILGLARRP
jgi:ubiquinone/menaquinone biosynthesis C-methylase UbiE